MKHNRMLFFLLAVAVLPAVAAPAPGSNAERVLARLKEVADSPNYYWHRSQKCTHITGH